MLRRAWPIPVLALVVAAIVYAVWPLTPKVYESQMTMMIVPQRVPADVVRPHPTMPALRLIGVRQRVLSRTSVETLIREFHLRQELHGLLPMEDIVDRVRQDIALRVAPLAGEGEGPLMVVSVVTHDPKVSRDVVARLSSLVINEMLQEREMQDEATHDFLASQADEVRDQLLTTARAIAAARAARKDDEARLLGLESEVLDATYKSLLTKRAEADVRMALDRRLLGEQFRMLEPARVPEHPLGPTRAAATVVGGVIGAVAGLLLMAWLASKRA